MKKLIFMLLCIFFLVSCVEKEITSEQSILDIVSDTVDYEDVTKESPSEETADETTEEVIGDELEDREITDETPVINKKCRYSTILYDGCKWQDPDKTNFDLRIINAGKSDISGVWFFYHTESGALKIVKRTGIVISQGTKTYNIDYASIVKEFGKIKKLEIYPIEVSNETEYACENMRVYTIPDTYCKSTTPPHITSYGTINTTRE